MGEGMEARNIMKHSGNLQALQFYQCIKLKKGSKSGIIESGSGDPLRPHGLYSPWNSPGQNTGVGSLSLLQGIFPTQRSDPGLPIAGRFLTS